MDTATFTNRNASYVRIRRTGTDVFVGAGFVVSPSHVMTCAHVVCTAIGQRDPSRCPEDTDVEISLMVDKETPVITRPLPRFWRPASSPAGDVAVLEIKGGGRFDARARAARATDRIRDGDRFTAFGVKRGLPEGTIVAGDMLGWLDEHYMLRASREDDAIREGCSGGAVWPDGSDRIAGMVVQWQEKTSGRMLPARYLADVYPDLMPGCVEPAPSRQQLNERLWSLLRGFDRHEQASRFEALLEAEWEGPRKPVACVIAGIARDMPDMCADRLSFDLRQRVGPAAPSRRGWNSHKLPWPTSRRFDRQDALLSLQNGLKSALKARSRSAGDLRDAYNASTNPLTLYSRMDRKCFSEQHRALASEWAAVLQDIGAAPLNKPLTHFILLTLDADERRAGGGEANARYYRDMFPSDRPAPVRLPLLAGFEADEVVAWVREAANELDLENRVATALEFQAHRHFTGLGHARFADVDRWVQSFHLEQA